MSVLTFNGISCHNRYLDPVTVMSATYALTAK